jgi:hypothetical protein
LGLETVGTILTIGKTLVDAFNPPKPPPKTPVISMQEATTQAGAQLNPLYDQRMKVVQTNVIKDNLNRGFQFQHAGNELAASTAADNERQRIAAISGLAQNIRQGSMDDAYRRDALNYGYNQWSTGRADQALTTANDWIKDADVLPDLRNLLPKKPKLSKPSGG